MSDRDARVKAIVLYSQDSCDAARALSDVLDLLVDANMQESSLPDDEGRDADYERVSEAKLMLFLIATELTNGYRNKTVKR